MNEGNEIDFHFIINRGKFVIITIALHTDQKGEQEEEEVVKGAKLVEGTESHLVVVNGNISFLAEQEEEEEEDEQKDRCHPIERQRQKLSAEKGQELKEERI